MTSPRALISGAGLAGCATAYWLRRSGYAVTMVERAPAPRPGGQTVDLRGVGRTVVERMGLWDAVRAVEVDQRGIAWIDAAGRRRAEMGVEAFGGRGIVSSDEVLRGDLADVLYAAVRDEVEVRFDDTVTALRSRADGVDVDFERTPGGHFDLVVGADGLHSAVRRLAFGPESDIVRPLGVLTAWFTVPAEVDLDGWYLMHNAVGGRVVSLRPGRLPGEQKAGLSLRTDPRPPGTPRATPAEHRALLAEHFADVGWEAARLVRHARTAPDFFAEDLGQVVLPSPVSGRVALVGDAGACPSPLTGLGTTLALAGAYVLAGELGRRGPDGVVEALDAYGRILQPYVRKAQQLPPGGVDGYAPRTATRIRLGQASMRWMNRWPVRPILEPVFARADALTLPDYPVGARAAG